MNKIGAETRRPGVLLASPELEEIQAIMPMDVADRERLKNDIKKNGMRDPIKIYTDVDGRPLVLGGWNRLQIALELGVEEIAVDIYDGTSEERRELVVADNLNRRQLTSEQKRNLVRYLYKQDPEQSARAVSKKTGADHKTVQKVKRDMVRRGEIPHVLKVIDAKGRKQPAVKHELAKSTSTPSRINKADVKRLIQQYIIKSRDPKKAVQELKSIIEQIADSLG